MTMQGDDDADYDDFIRRLANDPRLRPKRKANNKTVSMPQPGVSSSRPSSAVGGSQYAGLNFWDDVLYYVY